MAESEYTKEKGIRASDPESGSIDRRFSKYGIIDEDSKRKNFLYTPENKENKELCFIEKIGRSFFQSLFSPDITYHLGSIS